MGGIMNVLHLGPPIAIMRQVLAVLVAILAFGWASGSSSAQVADWEKVIAAAKAEGALVLYTALVGAPSTKAIAKAFEARYGIPVQVFEARAGKVRKRFRPKRPPGRYLANTILNPKTKPKIPTVKNKPTLLPNPFPMRQGLTPRSRTMASS